MPERRRKKPSNAGIFRRQRLVNPTALRKRGLTKFRLTGKAGDTHRLVIACPAGPIRRGKCVKQAILHFHR